VVGAEVVVIVAAVVHGFHSSIYGVEAVDECEVIEEITKWHKVQFHDWRNKGGVSHSHYSMQVGRFRYTSHRMQQHGLHLGKLFEVGITDYEGTKNKKCRREGVRHFYVQAIDGAKPFEDLQATTNG